MSPFAPNNQWPWQRGATPPAESCLEDIAFFRGSRSYNMKIQLTICKPAVECPLCGSRAIFWAWCIPPHLRRTPRRPAALAQRLSTHLRRTRRPADRQRQRPVDVPTFSASVRRQRRPVAQYRPSRRGLRDQPRHGPRVVERPGGGFRTNPHISSNSGVFL
jgi:hypothetical protein